MTGPFFELMKINLPLQFGPVQMEIDVKPALTLQGKLLRGLSTVAMAYHGYRIELSIGALEDVVRVVNRQLKEFDRGEV